MMRKTTRDVNDAGNNTTSSHPRRRVPATIRLSSSFLSAFSSHIRVAAAQGTRGLGSAGLLFGVVNGRELNVEKFRAFPIVEGSSTDDCKLSDSDFEECLAASLGDPELRVLALIGWYRLRARGDTKLVEDDARFHNLHFRRVSDLAVILKVESQTNSLAFYTRWPNASMLTERHRYASVDKMDGMSVSGPIQLVLRAKVNDDYQRRIYQVLDSLHEAQRTGKAISLPGRNAMPESDPSSNNITDKRSSPRDLTHTRGTLPSPGAIADPQSHPEPPYTDAGWTDTAGTRRLESKTKLWATSLAAIVITAAGVCTWLYFRDGRPPVQKRPIIDAWNGDSVNGLGLRVRAQGDTLLVSWDRQNRKIRSAKKGTLEIINGSDHRQIHLDSSEMANGSILYRSSSRDMTIRFKLGTGDSEEVRVLGGSNQATGMDTKNSSPIIPGKADRQVRLPTSITPNPANNQSAERVHSKTSHRESAFAASDRNATLADARLQAAPAIRPRSPVNRPLEKKGQLASDQPGAPDIAVGADLNSGRSEIAGKNLASVRVPVVRKELGSNPQSNLSVNPAPIITGSSASYLPARPVNQVLPELRPGFRSSLTDPTQINIMVSVDEEGRVTDAHITNSQADQNPMLARESLAAAKLWTFEPAKLHGRNVRSDHMITFVFRPKS